MADDDRRLPSQRNELLDIPEIELAIGIRKRDMLEAGGLESGSQRRAVAAIPHVPENANMRLRFGGLVGGGKCCVVTPIVHHQDFVIVRQARKRVIGLGDRLADARIFVVSRNDERKRPAATNACLHGPRLLRLGMVGPERFADWQNSVKPHRRP